MLFFNESSTKHEVQTKVAVLYKRKQKVAMQTSGSKVVQGTNPSCKSPFFPNPHSLCDYITMSSEDPGSPEL